MDVRYEAPETLQAAVALLAGATGPAKVLAGGTDVIVQMETDLIEPALIVDIKKIPEMRQIAAEDGGFRIGAAVPGMEIMGHAALCKAWPGVLDGVKLIGSIQVRGRASIGGNLCNGSPAADSVPPLIAAGAIARIVGEQGHPRGAGGADPDRARQDLARQGRDRRLVPAAAAAAAFRRRLSAIHAAHRDGHRGGRRRREPHARQRRHLHRGARRARRGGADGACSRRNAPTR